jgi:hypothetical protein
MKTMKTFENNELAKKYIADAGYFCPFCDSNDITGGHGEFEASSAFRNVTCLNCGREWTEEFGLTGVLFMEEEENTLDKWIEGVDLPQE